MSNVLYQPLPTYWHQYQINTDYRIGIQLSLLFDDPDISDKEREYYLIDLLFGNEDGTIRDYPKSAKEIGECLLWLLNGWYYDNPTDKQEKEIKVLDYNVDQGRIYADFLRFYHIDLSEAEMHYWKFQWLLWNLPEESAFMRVLEIRTKKPRKKASADEIKAIKDAQKIYGLGQKKKAYTDQENKAIDEFDKMMEILEKNNRKEDTDGI